MLAVMTTETSGVDRIEPNLETLLTLLKKICETPAPTFNEGERGKLVSRLLAKAGLEPETDGVGNVTAEVEGGTGPRIVIAAHLDTVFSLETDVTVKKDGDRLRAPGIGDNSSSLAVMIHYAQNLKPTMPRPRLTLAATVGEEGLGDLYGVRELMKNRAQDFGGFIALDGHLGTVVNQAVGSKRFEVTFHAKGGHSWGDYPSPSAVHALGEAIHALTKLKVPSEPRSSLNVGQVSGGTSINAIAQEAQFNLDLRSLDAKVLANLENDALKRIKRAAKAHKAEVKLKQVGDRSAAQSDNKKLVTMAKLALQQVGATVRTAASSTDANAAMAVGLPAISFGVYRGGDAHRQSEWMDPDSLITGYRALEHLMAQLSESSQ